MMRRVGRALLLVGACALLTAAALAPKYAVGLSLIALCFIVTPAILAVLEALWPS